MHRAVLKHGAQRGGDLRGEVKGDEVRSEGGNGFLEDLEPSLRAEGEEDAFFGDSLDIVSMCNFGKGIIKQEGGLEGCTFSMITSYAEIRSVATKRRVLSSTSYRSRTLPRAMRGRDPWRSVVVREEAIVNVWEELEVETRSG